MATKYVVKDISKNLYLRRAKGFGSNGTQRYAEEDIENATIFHRKCDASNACGYWSKNAVAVKVKVKIKEKANQND